MNPDPGAFSLSPLKKLPLSTCYKPAAFSSAAASAPPRRLQSWVETRAARFATLDHLGDFFESCSATRRNTRGAGQAVPGIFWISSGREEVPMEARAHDRPHLASAHPFGPSAPRRAIPRRFGFEARPAIRLRPEPLRRSISRSAASKHAHAQRTELSFLLRDRVRRLPG